MRSVKEMKAGESGEIKWMYGNRDVLARAAHFDIREGCLIRVYQRFRDSLIIGLGNRRFAIGNEVAECLKV